MNTSHQSELYQIWLKLLNTSKTKDGEFWLDVFLEKYIAALGSDDAVGQLFCFGWKSSGNILAHQLLSDMYQICEEVNVGSSNEAETVSGHFKKYLFEGRGWKLLWTLDSVGIQNLTCLKDLMKLLILHIPVVISLPVEDSNIPASLQRKPSNLALEQCFNIDKVNNHDTCHFHSKSTKISSVKKHRNYRGKKRIRKKKPSSERQNLESSSEEDHLVLEPCVIPASQIRTFQKVCKNSTSANKSQSEADDCEQDLFDGSTCDTNFHDSYKISVTDYMNFILNFFQKAVLLDKKSSQHCSTSSPLILEFALNTLKRIQTSSYKFENWSPDCVQNLKYHLLRLVFTSASVTNNNTDYTGAPNANEILSSLLLISSDIISSLPSQIVRYDSLQFVCDIIIGALMLIHNTIQTCAGDYSKIICIIKTFMTMEGSNVCCNAINILDRNFSVELASQISTIVVLIKDIILLLKLMRTLCNHHITCQKDVYKYVHHHNDIFGPPESHSIISPEPVCCVTTMNCLLFKIFSVCVSKESLNIALKYLRNSGICCCANPSFILRMLLSKFANYDADLQHSVLVLIEKHIFFQLGLTTNSKELCPFCAKYPVPTEITYLSLVHKSSGASQEIQDRKCAHQQSSVFWSSVNIYIDLLNSNSLETVEKICKHLIHLFVIGVSELKTQIFVKVILPQFLILNSLFDQPLSQLVKVKVKCFLTILTSVLDDNSFSAVFVNLGGMPVLYQFLFVKEFRPLALHVFEILIASEQELTKHTGEMTLSTCSENILHLYILSTFCDFVSLHTQELLQQLTKHLTQKGWAARESSDTDESVIDYDFYKEQKTCFPENGNVNISSSNLGENLDFICSLWASYKMMIHKLQIDYILKLSKKAMKSGYKFFLFLLENLSSVLNCISVEADEITENILLLIQNFLDVFMRTKEEVSKEELIRIIQYNITVHAPKCMNIQINLFDLILKCSLSSSLVLVNDGKSHYCNGQEYGENFEGAISSEKECSDCSPEESYAADSEKSSSDGTSSPKPSSKHQRKISVIGNVIQHGEIIKMTLEILSHFQAENFAMWSPISLHVIHTLGNLSKEYKQNVSVLCEQEIPKLLLDIFATSLKSGDIHVKEFQLSTMNLFTTLAQWSLLSCDLKKMICFFKSPHVHIDILLNIFSKIINSADEQPIYSMTFPCTQKSDSKQYKKRKRYKTACDAHLLATSQKDVASAWASSALIFPITSDCKWSTVKKGFSFTIWIKLNDIRQKFHSTLSCENSLCQKYCSESQPSSKVEMNSNMLHIVSFGSNKFLIEMWCIQTGDIIIRTCSYTTTETVCLSMSSSKSLLKQDKWSHIALNYSETAEKAFIESKIHLVLNGIKSKLFNLRYKKSEVKAVTQCYLLLGHSVPENEDYLNHILPSISFGSFMFFKDAVLSRDIIFYLSSLGPYELNISLCAVQKYDKFIPKHAHYHNPDPAISHDILTGMNVPSLDSLQDSLLCSYTAETPNIYLVYASSQRGIFPFRASFSGRKTAHVPTSQEYFSQSQPSEMNVLTVGMIKQNIHHGLQQAIQRIGGMSVFLFLYAHVLEHDGSNENIAQALNLLLTLLNKSTIFARDFDQINGYNLLIQIITNNCSVSPAILQVFLQNCISFGSSNKRLAPKSNPNEPNNAAVITSAKIFALMLNAVAFAKNTLQNVMTILFTVLDSLLNEKHSNLHFNIRQMMSVHTMDILLHLLKKKYILGEEAPLPVDVAKLIPMLIQKLLSHNFDVLVLQSICHLLLLLHRASSTFVCHSRSAFFFLFPVDKFGFRRKVGLGRTKSSVLNLQNKQHEVDSKSPSHLKEARMNKGPHLVRSASFHGEHTQSASVTEFVPYQRVKSQEQLSASEPLEKELGFLLISRSIPTDVPNAASRVDHKSRFIAKKIHSSLYEDDSIEAICVGLLNLIENLIVRENKKEAETVMVFLQPQIFVVLANNSSIQVRTSVLKVIQTYLKIADDAKKNEFLYIKGFHLLANQLHQLQVDRKILDICFSIIYDHPFSSIDSLSLPGDEEISTYQIMAWVPVLGVLSRIHLDLLPCSKVLSFLRMFLRRDIKVVSELTKNGLCESLVRLLLVIAHSQKREEGSNNQAEANSVMSEIESVLKYMSVELCSSRNFKDFLAFNHILKLFSALERRSVSDCGHGSSCVTHLRNCLCVMYQSSIEFFDLYSRYPLKLDLWASNDNLDNYDPIIGSPSESESCLTASVRCDVEKAVNEVPLNEIIYKLQKLIAGASEFVIFKNPEIVISRKEATFFKMLFLFIFKGIVTVMEKNRGTSRTRSMMLMWSMKDVLKKKMISLLLSSVAPQQSTEQKEYVLNVLSSYPMSKKILHLMIFSIPKIEYLLAFLLDAQRGDYNDNIRQRSQVVYDIIKSLLQGSKVLDVQGNNPLIEKLKSEWLELWNDDRNKWMEKEEKSAERVFQRMENLAQEISVFAMDVTQKIFDIQNIERKKFMEELKMSYCDEVSARSSWIKLCDHMTHERAIWHIKECNPYAWELDPTEGPYRIRRRLKRCHLNIDSRFLMPEFAERLAKLKRNKPFVSLLENQNEYSDSAAVIHRLFADEKIEFTCPCKIVTAFEEIKAEILIGDHCIHVIGEEKSSLTEYVPFSESWKFEFIREILFRRFELQNNACEIFLTNGVTYLIAFPTEKDLQSVWKRFEDHDLPCQNSADVTTLTQLWRDSSITNFEYLTQLNKFAGRTFNDLMQYPVFPFVLADYGSPFLNLEDPAVYRNLSKPVAVQHKYREQFYINTYNWLKEQCCEQSGESELPVASPYHYGSHYSNSGTVLYFLIRLLPYTYSFITYQDNNFDIPDRTFHTMETSWHLVTKDSTSDVKELIPEFFFLPEFFCNKEGFDFGVQQTGVRVNHVLLPPWCKQNPRLFILIHRQALESDYVKNNLNNWIDLVYGYKQTGEEAINALNVFHPATYFGLDVNKSKDPITRQALKAMIKTVGQMPQQLFTTPHPMISLSLANLEHLDQNTPCMEVIDTVEGLKWGNYVGSPSTGTPNLVWCRKQSVVLGSFLPVLTNYVFGLGQNICLLLNHKKDKSSISSATYIMSAALISWGHKDGIVRIKLCRDQPALSLLKESNLDPICLCASVPDSKELFVAHSSGVIFVYTLHIDLVTYSISEEQLPRQLNAHSAAITALYISKAFSIFVSASEDKTLVIWDLNRLCYVRSICDHDCPVKAICVSDTLGDIASVSCYAGGSTLKVHTINGEYVGSVDVSETITCVCYSTAPEGISVNVVATGLNTGAIRLWSSWDLKPVREISCEKFILPVKCLIFSSDNQHLYAANKEGIVAVWEKPSRGLADVPRLLIFT